MAETRFTAQNTRGASVWHFGQKIERVVEVDLKAKTVTVLSQPVRSNADGDVCTEVYDFEFIHPIYAGGKYPCAFMCYGPCQGGRHG